MSDLTDLYQEVILDHNKRPRNYGTLENASAHAHGHNPLCGDKLTLYLRVDAGTVREVKFVGSGCAISKASASLMTEAIAGRSVSDAVQFFDRFQALMTTPIDQPVDAESFGKLAALAGVREFPMRVKCATLAWHTLKAALAKSDDVAKTE